MPKTAIDKDLLSQVNEFISKCPTPNSAADKLGVDRTTLWRFKDSGRALTKTRNLLREGLSRQKVSESDYVSVKRNAMVPANDEVAEIRRFCNSLLTLLDERDRWVNNIGQQAQAGRGATARQQAKGA